MIVSQLMEEYLDQEHMDKKGTNFDFDGWTSCFGDVSDTLTLMVLDILLNPVIGFSSAGQRVRLWRFLMPNSRSIGPWERPHSVRRYRFRLQCGQHAVFEEVDGAGDRAGKARA